MAGQSESANLSQRSRRKFSESQRERLRGSVRRYESVPIPFTESVRRLRRTRSHFSLVANRRRGSVNRSPQGAIRGGFAVSPQNSERFARCACCCGALAAARRERRASSMSAAWDSSPALSPVPWGERSREAFNCVPGDQQSAPLINSFDVRDGAEPVHHRGDGSRRATNGARLGAWRTGRARFVGVLAGVGGPINLRSPRSAAWVCAMTSAAVAGAH